jgi:hypothetical protein
MKVPTRKGRAKANAFDNMTARVGSEHIEEIVLAASRLKQDLQNSFRNDDPIRSIAAFPR